MMPFDALEEKFRRLQIATDAAGFQNRQEFLDAEKDEPRLLDDFAMWVLQKPQLSSMRAAELVEAAAIRMATVAEGAGPGRCQDLSFLFGHLLDAMGVYNFTVAGSTVVFRSGQYLTGLHVHDSLDQSATSTGHFWVCAPPYFVVDVSLARQHGDLSLLPIPTILLSREADTDFVITVEDVVPPLARPTSIDLCADQEFAERVGVSHCDFGEYQVRYVPAAIKAPDTPLEEWRDFLQLGESPASFVSRTASELRD